MLIANPIYDVVFKYMMEDLQVAKTFVSAIIGDDVTELDFCPQELTTKYKIYNQSFRNKLRSQ
jgi:DNA-binding ferritin-like protein (Dps family)